MKKSAIATCFENRIFYKFPLQAYVVGELIVVYCLYLHIDSPSSPPHLTTLPPLLPPFSNNTWNAAPINVRVCIKGREGHVISDLEWRIKFVCNNEVIWSVTFLWPGLSVCRSVSRSLFSKISEYLFPMRYVSITYNHGTFTLLTFFVFIHRSLKLLRIFLKLLFFDRKQCKTPDTYL